MDSRSQLNHLKKKRDQLLEEQERILSQIKNDHPDFYHWLVEKEISKEQLIFAALNLTAGIALAGGVMVNEPTSPQTPREYISQLTPQVHVIQVEELKGLTEDEKADLVMERYGPIITRAAKKYDLDPKLIFATIMLESGGNTFAVRYEPHIGDASYGLGQILYGTARGIGFEGKPQDLFDPEINIDLIAKYHKRNLDVYGGNLTAEQLTICYNTGTPWGYPTAGHLSKFEKWFGKANKLVV